MKDEILTFALENAMEHNGKASAGPVIGRMIAAHPDLKSDVKTLTGTVSEIVKQVNVMDMKEIEQLLEKLGGPIELRKRERKDPMIPLEDTEEGVRMRFAPGPSGPLHIGHTRAAILNDEYCRRYDGKFILRLEDTNPEKIDPDAYQMIREDLKWLDIDIHEIHIQSDRFELYYDVIEKLLDKDNAYVCTMDMEEWRELKTNGKACQERTESKEKKMEKWDRMLEGHYGEGEAAVMVKTDLHHRNPAVRDFVAMRIRHIPHPRTGDRYHLYPLYNFSVAVDDHFMKCTHILRGNDHLNNTYRQKYVFDHMEWKYPHFIHYGLVSIPDTLLKTSLIKEEIASRNFDGWDDVRLGTIRALGKRGFDPRAIRRYWKEVGVKSVDISFTWETFETMNREFIDSEADRYFFVKDPIRISIDSASDIHGRSPKHPEFPGRGYRHYHLKVNEGRVTVFLPQTEMITVEEGDMIRLKDLCNVRIGDDLKTIYHAGNDTSSIRDRNMKIIEWVSEDSIDCQVNMPDGSKLAGLAEIEAMKAARNNNVVQFERVGFCRLEAEEMMIRGYFAHK